jgi:hypothetical protein
MVDVGTKPFSQPDVGQGMVVRGGPVALGIEGGVDEADIG